MGNRSLTRIALLAAGCALAATVPAAVAAEPDMQAEITSYFEESVAAWVDGPEVVAAIKAQNRETRYFTQTEIEALDTAWRAEVASDSNVRPMIDEFMKRDISGYLKERQREADWMIVEIIVMDAKGLNVGLSTPSSDYWQGDEAKHENTYQAAAAAPFIDEIEFEPETGLLLSQVNKTIFDPATGQPIGAVTVSINMNKL